jgi:hypothetical protein
MRFTENADISSIDNLAIVEKHGYVELHDKVKGFLGNFEVLHDSTHQNDEYLTLNGIKFYIDDMDYLR